MKKALIIVMAVLGLVSSVFFSFRDEGAVATSAGQEWPGQMGNLQKAEERWPLVEPNEASKKVTSLAEALPKNDKTWTLLWSAKSHATNSQSASRQR